MATQTGCSPGTYSGEANSQALVPQPGALIHRAIQPTRVMQPASNIRSKRKPRCALFLKHVRDWKMGYNISLHEPETDSQMTRQFSWEEKIFVFSLPRTYILYVQLCSDIVIYGWHRVSELSANYTQSFLWTLELGP